MGVAASVWSAAARIPRKPIPGWQGSPPCVISGAGAARSVCCGVSCRGYGGEDGQEWRKAENISNFKKYRPMREKTQLNLELFPKINLLQELAKAENECTRCPLYKDATQAVPGEGRKSAHVMLVGEQPGDKEDLSGKPFVGPAGRVLDRALADAGIPRTEVFVTNAVKHFKHEMRGKRRLHKRPNAYEIERCKIWLDLERAIVKPV